MQATLRRPLTAWLLLLAATGLGQTLNLPPRPAGAPTGSQFIDVVRPLSLTERENWIFAQVVSGNVPQFLRVLKAITLSANINGTNHTATYYAAPDYLAIGNDSDYFLEPMTPLLAQRLCDRLGCTLPTRKMANQIWTNATVKLSPQPIAPSGDMITVPVFAQHNSMVRTQRSAFTNSFPLGALVSGDKKDVVVSTLICSNLHSGVPKPVVIYGWHYTSGSPIQPLYNGHEETYADYSHGVRLVQNAMRVDDSPNTVTNVLTNPNLAGLLSDEGIAEATSAGVILVPRYALAPQAPVIITPPRSQTVLPGASATFQAFAIGDLPLGYQWQSNGAPLAGATNPILALSNVLLANAASYSIVATNCTGSVTSRVAFLRLNDHPRPVVFGDDFDTDTSANWCCFWGAANGLPDYTLDWAFDYSATCYSFNGSAALIPPAPNSPADSTHGLRLTVNNNDALGATAAVNVYPGVDRFSGNYAFKFDLWINYPGGAGGISSTGSTEHAIFGLNHLGTRINWPASPASDGLWFGLDGEGGTSTDYRAYLGNFGGAPTDLTLSAASGLTASNNTASIYQALFPSSRFETAGAPGKNWVEAELRQTNHTILWLLDGTVIAQRTNSSPFNAGTIMLGYMDVFSSIANPAADAFVLFDNVRVEDLDHTERFLSASATGAGSVRLVLSAVPGRSYALEASTNLINWTTVSAQTAGNAPLLFLDTNGPTSNQRFYRARVSGL